VSDPIPVTVPAPVPVIVPVAVCVLLCDKTPSQPQSRTMDLFCAATMRPCCEHQSTGRALRPSSRSGNRFWYDTILTSSPPFITLKGLVDDNNERKMIE
jgi:hypothetical protein